MGKKNRAGLNILTISDALLSNLCFFLRYYTNMAPVSAAEGQRKWRETLKASGSYEAYKAKRIQQEISPEKDNIWKP